MNFILIISPVCVLATVFMVNEDYDNDHPTFVPLYLYSIMIPVQPPHSTYSYSLSLL